MSDISEWPPQALERLTHAVLGAADYFGTAPFPQYLAEPRWSQSMLACFRRRRRLAEARYVTFEAPPEKATDEMQLGTLAHAAILEPERFRDHYAVYPPELLAKNGAASTNAAKDWADEQIAAGRAPLKRQQYDQLAAMSNSVRETCGDWLAQPRLTEHTVYWHDPATGLPLKARLDWLITKPDRAFVFDLKTLACCAPWAFAASVERYSYWLQDAHYRAAVAAATGLPLEAISFLFVVVESDYPHGCAVYRLSPADAEKARLQRANLIDEVCECLRTGDWSDSWEGNVTTLELKPWAMETND